MRVAMIDPSLFTLPYDQALACGLAHGGHDVTIHGRRPGPDDSSPPGVPLAATFYRVAGSRAVSALPDRLRRAVKGLDHAWSMGRLLRLLRAERPDVIHFQWLPLPIVDRAMLGRLARIAPLVVTVHDTNPHNGDPGRRLQAQGFFGCLGHFGRIIVHTAQGEARLRARGVPARRLVVLPHGPMAAPEASRRPDAMQGPMTFVLFGKIKPYKGADTLIEAFARLPEALRAQARVRIVGKPYMDLAPLEDLARRLGVAEQVSIEPRFVADDEISALFAPGTVAVFPYREIDTSGVLPQALAHGRPIVASRLGVFAETLADGTHGHLAPSDDVDGFAASLAHLVADRDFAAACAGHALALSQAGMDWDTIAQRTAATYMAAGAEREAGAESRVPVGVSRAMAISSSTRNSTGGNC